MARKVKDREKCETVIVGTTQDPDELNREISLKCIQTKSDDHLHIFVWDPSDNSVD